MKKPALDEKVERVALMRKQLLRVLDDDGGAVGEWVPDLSVDDKLAGLRNMMLVRSCAPTGRARSRSTCNRSAKRRSHAPNSKRSSAATCIFRRTASRAC